MPANEAYKIAKWFDNPNHLLAKRYQQNQEKCLSTLNEKAILISTSTSTDWTGEYGCSNISRCLKGIQGLDPNIDAVKNVLTVLTNKLYELETPLKAEHIKDIFNGLQSMDATTSEVKAILKALTVKIDQTSLNAEAIVHVLHALQMMNATSDEVKDLLDAVTVEINLWQGSLNAKDIMALYGLRRMDATSPEVKALLKALTVKIDPTALDALAIGMALYGLQNMDATSDEVKALLNVLTTAINLFQGSLSAKHIGMALLGLQNMDATIPEVKDLLKALTAQINKPQVSLDAIAIENGLCGLQNMDATIPEVKALLHAFTEKINQSQRLFDDKRIAKGFLGLQKMDATIPEVKALVEACEQKMPPYNRLVKDASSRKIMASAYIFLSKILDNGEEFLKLKFKDIFGPVKVGTNFEEIFKAELLSEHYKNGTLDLRGLDHLTTKYLLDNFDCRLLGNGKQVIFDKASYFSSSTNTMKKIVENWIKEKNLSGITENECTYIVKRTTHYIETNEEKTKEDNEPAILKQLETKYLKLWQSVTLTQKLNEWQKAEFILKFNEAWQEALSVQERNKTAEFKPKLSKAWQEAVEQFLNEAWQKAKKQFLAEAWQKEAVALKFNEVWQEAILEYPESPIILREPPPPSILGLDNTTAIGIHCAV